ncbi:MAG: HEPN domain-containing protein [Egibacteraceae bacterium]
MSVQPDSPLVEACHWLELARDDLLSADTLLCHQERAWSVVAFLAQQCAEKALKAAARRVLSVCEASVASNEAE